MLWLPQQHHLNRLDGPLADGAAKLAGLTARRGDDRDDEAARANKVGKSWKLDAASDVPPDFCGDSPGLCPVIYEHMPEAGLDTWLNEVGGCRKLRSAEFRKVGAELAGGDLPDAGLLAKFENGVGGYERLRAERLGPSGGKAALFYGKRPGNKVALPADKWGCGEPSGLNHPSECPLHAV